jgi:hypothetical protein
MKVLKTSRGVVAAWREKIGYHATALRRNERKRNFLRIIKALRSGVAAWRETFKPHVASLRRGVKKNKPHATTQRRNEKLKKN